MGEYNTGGIKIGNPIASASSSTKIENVLRAYSIEPYGGGTSLESTSIYIGTDAIASTIHIGSITGVGTTFINGTVIFTGGTINFGANELISSLYQWA